jgi:hypothetical protein
MKSGILILLVAISLDEKQKTATNGSFMTAFFVTIQ